jgi:hypothetical protein
VASAASSLLTPLPQPFAAVTALLWLLPSSLHVVSLACSTNDKGKKRPLAEPDVAVPGGTVQKGISRLDWKVNQIACLYSQKGDVARGVCTSHSRLSCKW